MTRPFNASGKTLKAAIGALDGDPVERDLGTATSALKGGTLGGAAVLLGSLAGVGGNWVQAIVGLGAGTIAAVAVKLRRDHLYDVAKALFDREDNQRLLADLKARLLIGGIAARRGHVWVAYEAGSETPVVLSEAEYRGWREKVRVVTEVEFTPLTMRIARMRDGELDSVTTGEPAHQVIDMRTGATVERRWMLAGCEVPEAVARAEFEDFKADHDRLMATGDDVVAGMLP